MFEDTTDYLTPTFTEVNLPSNQTSSYTPVIDVDSPSFKPVLTEFCVPGNAPSSSSQSSSQKNTYISPSPKVMVWKYLGPGFVVSMVDASNDYIFTRKLEFLHLKVWSRKS